MGRATMTRARPERNPFHSRRRPPSVLVPLTVGVMAVSLAALLIGEYRGDRASAWITKPMTSAGFVVLAFLVDAQASTYGRFVLVALVFSFAGDVLLIPRNKRFFLAGLAVFLFGHVAYVAAFAFLGVALPWFAGSLVVLGLVAAVVTRALLPYVARKMRGPVVAYVVIITTMVAAAAGAVAAGATPVILGGALAFYVSDLAVARNRFVKPGFVNRAWGLPLYYGAQVAFALTAAAPLA